MAGWNLKEGKYLGLGISEDELWSLFNYVFSDSCKKTNTYKFGLIKAICDHIYDLKNNDGLFFLSFDNLFAKFTENYWNLVNKYELKQMAYNGKSEFSRIETIIKASVKESDIPQNISFQSLSSNDRNRIIKLVTTDCKRCVIGALYNDFEGKLYSFDLRGDGIYLGQEAHSFISKYKAEIEKINYYSWARFLENINDDSVLVKVLDKLDNATPRRNDLSIYQEVLYREFQENNCFYCGKKLNNKIHVDHFIPWSFIKTDNLWNFVLACPRCNIKKSNSLVDVGFVDRLEQRNEAIIGKHNSRIVSDEYSSYYNGLISKIWSYAKMSGLRERTINY